jgi:four helix bundle protein
MNKLSRFQDLQVWQEAHQLVLTVYRITRLFPDDEKYGRVSQMRRAAVSVPANIVEGFNRRGIRDKLHFYNVAESSLEELKYFFILSGGPGYMQTDKNITEHAERVGRLLQGLISSTQKRIKQ